MLSISRSLFLIHAGILLTVALIPVWHRLPQTPPLLPPLYVSRFLILLPMLWTIFWWLVAGLPGVAELRHDRLRALWALALLTLSLWGFASQGWAFQRVPHPEVAQTASLQLGLVALFAVVMACAGPSKHSILGVLVFSLVWNSLIGGWQIATQSAVGLVALGEFPIAVDWPGVSVVQAGDVRWLRPYALLPHPNPLAGVLVVGVQATGAWILFKRRAVWLLGTLVAMGGLWVLLLTFSRAAWVGLVVSALALLPYLWSKRRSINRKRFLVTLALVMGTGIVFAALYQPFLLARSGVATTSIEQRSLSDRRVFTEFALRAVQEHPVLGVGIGNFPWQASFYLMSTDFDLRGDNVHNIYLSAWAELGTVGLVLYVGALLAGLIVAFRQRHDVESAALLAGVVALAAIGLFDHYPYSLIQFQVALWGLLAAAGQRTEHNHPEEVIPTG